MEICEWCRQEVDSQLERVDNYWVCKECRGDTHYEEEDFDDYE